MKKINWLHLSDLHVGCKEYGWIWPTIKKSFFEDIKRQHDKNGPWDLVVFTGDLTFSGQEYQEFENLLQEIWAKFLEVGSTPQLAIIPGNHDFVRPGHLSAIAKAFGTWHSDIDLRRAFWETEENEYKIFIKHAFQNYLTWVSSTKIPLISSKRGLIPGDFSASLSFNGCSLGIVGLNTAFLQLSDDFCEGKLSIHQKQFHDLLGSSFTEWFKAHDFNMLTWLCP